MQRTIFLLLSVFVITQLFNYAWSTRKHSSRFIKRADPVNTWAEKQCDNIWEHEDQCAYVLEHCSETIPSLINYLQWYYCSGSVKPLVLICLSTWLLFLFGFVGIAASDFFCPNLQTLAAALHLSESMTGVTFLAFGNGSPDVFSTFSAMQSNLGSLALGELIGAASFIVSVVAGTMCAIRPFRAKRLSFLRDVSFFTVALILVLLIVADGLIHLYEAIILIVYYVIYVAVVVGGNYYVKRRSAYMNLVERARAEYEDSDGDMDRLLRIDHRDWRDEDSGEDEMELYDEGFETEGFGSHLSIPSSARHDPAHPSQQSKLHIRSSLFAALEFRDVVQSLEQANARRHSTSGLRNRIHRVSLQAQPSSASLHTINHPENYQNPHLEDMENDELDGEQVDNNDIEQSTEDRNPAFPQPQDHVERQLDPASLSAIAKISSKILDVLHPVTSRIPMANVELPEMEKVLITLFPSLIKFRKKPLYSKISSLLSAPVIFLLTITLPVVTEDSLSSSSGGVRLDEDSETVLQNMDEDDILVDFDPTSNSLEWQRWLTVTHLLMSTLFASLVLTSLGVGPAALIIPIFVATGAVLSVLLLLTTSAHRRPPLFWMMCFVGFIVAVLWIYVIANEVVGVLQTIGFALGISDAILGLTVFAMGNSLGDFVANVTMARMGYPMMAISACFGGPMLNLLLGIGISATYVTTQRNEPYAIEVGPTIAVSGIGLLVILISALILVPLNKYRMSRAFGYAWIAIYVVCTIINVLIEVSHRS
ncbi:Sodium/calcium exchanger protein-domain-containing protein [Umbelopsis sp. AD052]|nr:Sodium/calcium exchanger protein-domain-containing protein [Umbelopsis sp. AD052]